ncbi:LytR/AlgR family response regulator transcription factor [Ekhidna lutea]|uniref:LytR/AlgR family response regulator transcription factor n=1 Tax=Ekhidna lutea TaxID=447679 RepID=UPI00117D53E1|nr:LytTR family DNA-binding domain-containing protein [Ekhidna lutea]
MLRDLDGDGITEEILKKNELDNHASIHIITESGDYQSNFRINWLESEPLFFGDYNKNQILEIYGFQFANDSLFISGLEYPNKIIIDSEYITSGFSDLPSSQFKGEILSLKKSGKDHLIISVMSGYGAKPRNIFMYDFAGDFWIKTPDSLQNYQQFFGSDDINNDGRNELITWGRAPDNNHDGARFSDQNSYIMVYDQELKLIDWMKAEGLPSYSFYISDSINKYMGLYSGRSKKTEIYSYQSSGRKELVETLNSNRILQYSNVHNSSVFQMIEDGNFCWISIGEEFEIINKIDLAENHNVIRLLKDQSIIYFDRNNHDLYYAASVNAIPIKIDGIEYKPGVQYSIGFRESQRVLLVSHLFENYYYTISDIPLIKYRFWVAMLSVLLIFGSYLLVPWHLIKLKKIKKVNTLRLNTRTGFEIIPQDEILFCKADGKYTVVQTTDNGGIISSSNLGAIQTSLNNQTFIRLGRSIVVNKKYIRKVDRKNPKVIFKTPAGIKEVNLSANEARELAQSF